jgi:hypothetical protein
MRTESSEMVSTIYIFYNNMLYMINIYNVYVS